MPNQGSKNPRVYSGSIKITANYTRKDFDRIMEISDACYSGDDRPPRETMMEMVSISDIFLARSSASNHIYGFAIVRNVDSPYLWSIAVDKNAQGTGIGSNLLRAILHCYRREKQITLHVNVHNPAMWMYHKYGFKVYDIARGYYGNTDGFCMKLVLDNAPGSGTISLGELSGGTHENAASSSSDTWINPGAGDCDCDTFSDSHI